MSHAELSSPADRLQNRCTLAFLPGPLTRTSPIFEIRCAYSAELSHCHMRLGSLNKHKASDASTECERLPPQREAASDHPVLVQYHDAVRHGNGLSFTARL